MKRKENLTGGVSCRLVLNCGECSFYEDDKEENGGEETKGDDKEIKDRGLSVEQKTTMVRDLLSSSSKEEDKEMKRKKADDRAWARRKREAMVRDLITAGH
jgi:hypothetical protein